MVDYWRSGDMYGDIAVEVAVTPVLDQGPRTALSVTAH